MDFFLAIYTILGHIDNYSNTPRSFCQYCRDKSALEDGSAIVDFTNYDINDSFKFKVKKKDVTKKGKRWHKTCWNNGIIIISK